MDILQKFEKYLLTRKQVSINTFNFYVKDINNFMHFLKSQNKSIDNIKKQDVQDYFKSLIYSYTGKSAAVRKKSAINCFLEYLHKYHEYPDLTLDFKFFSNFPILISNQEIELALNKTLNKENISFIELKSSLLVMLIYYSQVSIKDVIKLKLSDFDYNNYSLILKVKQKTKKISLPKSLFKTLELYKSKLKALKYNNIYDFIFPIKKGAKVEPIAYSSVWPLIKNFLNINKERNLNLVTKNIDNNYNNIDHSFAVAYKKSHPRS